MDLADRQLVLFKIEYGVQIKVAGGKLLSFHSLPFSILKHSTHIQKPVHCLKKLMINSA
jgi:hypothetical protein